MSDGDRRTLDPSTARRLDQVAKLVGVGLVALGLEVGGGTPLGLGLGVAGALLALATVFVPVGSESVEGSTDGDASG